MASCILLFLRTCLLFLLILLPRGVGHQFVVREEKPVPLLFFSLPLPSQLLSPLTYEALAGSSHVHLVLIPGLQLLYYLVLACTTQSFRLALVTCSDLPRASFPLSDIGEESVLCTYYPSQGSMSAYAARYPVLRSELTTRSKSRVTE